MEEGARRLMRKVRTQGMGWRIHASCGGSDLCDGIDEEDDEDTVLDARSGPILMQRCEHTRTCSLLRTGTAAALRYRPTQSIARRPLRLPRRARRIGFDPARFSIAARSLIPRRHPANRGIKTARPANTDRAMFHGAGFPPAITSRHHVADTRRPSPARASRPRLFNHDASSTSNASTAVAPTSIR